jgi:DNA replication protein DnaC
MLIQPTIDKMNTMKMYGMRDAFLHLLESPDADDLSFEQRVAIMIEREWTERQDRKMKARLRKARLKQDAQMAAIDYRHQRGLDRGVMESLASCRWVKGHQNILITGATGLGKTFISCALADMACQQGATALYKRTSRLFQEITMARADGTLPKLQARLARTSVLVVDDWGLAQLTDQERRDFLDILEDREGTGSTIVASQLPVRSWFEVVGDPTIADAIMDRLVHNAHRIKLKQGPSLRKQHAQNAQAGDADGSDTDNSKQETD